MNILCIESSGENCSVALSCDGEMKDFLETTQGLQHAEVLAEYCQLIVKNNLASFKSLNAVAISKGPGSYTGLRIGYSFAKGLCYSLNIPLIGIDTLFILAYHCLQKKHDTFCVPMIDARRMEVYMSMYNSNLEIVTEPQSVILDSPDTVDFFVQQKKHITLTGNGSSKFQAIAAKFNLQVSFVEQSLSAILMPEIASNYYLEKNFEDIAYSVPFYLKNFTATASKKSYFARL